jgi:protein-tyrosine phosphatase
VEDKKATQYVYKNSILNISILTQIIFRSRNSIDHITDNIYLGDLRAADDLSLLQEYGITHIINCPEALPEVFPENFVYLSLNLKDNLEQDIKEPVKKSISFLKKNQGKFLIHCKQGASRSASIVLAYLIIEKQMTLSDALEKLKSIREVVEPNSNFLNQLKEIERDINEFLNFEGFDK